MNAIVALCHFCELHGPSVVFCTQSFHAKTPDFGLTEEESQQECVASALRRSTSVTEASTPSSEFPPKSTDYCEACRSLQPGQSGFISHDHEARVYYTSGQHPDHPQAFSMVRQACVRSLTCEVCPGREGPIFFGDRQGGHVLSYTFFIKDSQARGLKRWYSIMVVMMDKIFLLNSWPFLVKHIENIKNDLQRKANKVYEEEQAKCPQRSKRLNMSWNATGPAGFRQRRGLTKPARSLAELTNDTDVFISLHQSFAWMIKAGGNRLTERLFEGPPTEDSIIDMEKQEETEEGFLMLFKKKLTVDSDTASPNNKTVEQLLAEQPGPKFRNLKHVLKVLGYQTFHSLAHHTVIGNQIIVQGYHKGLVISLIQALTVLLPKGCCRVVPDSSSYEDSWRCNFLGLDPEIAIPKHVELYAIVNIFPKDEREDIGDKMEDYTFTFASPINLSEKAPAVLTKMEFALINDKLGESVIDLALTCSKVEWMNKVKVLFKFTKAGGNRSEDDTRKLLQIVGAREEDKAVLMFWMTGLSLQYRNHMLSTAKDDLA